MTTRNRYLPVLEQFTQHMDSKLGEPQNVDKEHWNDQSIDWLMLHLRREVQELEDAVYAYRYGGMVFPVMARMEAIDVANLAMMVWDRLNFEARRLKAMKPPAGFEATRLARHTSELCMVITPTERDGRLLGECYLNKAHIGAHKA